MGRKLNELHPYVEQLAEKFLAECKEQGITVLIYQTYRSNKEQDELYAQGRTKAGTRVTNAKGGQSYHNYGLAFDCVPIIDYKAQWKRLDLYAKMGQIGKSLGLEWGGDFKSFKDRPHFQFTFGISIKELLSGKRPPSIIPEAKNTFKQAIVTLAEKGVISSPNYWLNSDMYELQYVKKLVNNFTKKDTFEESIQYLADNQVINSPDYWINNSTFSMENIKLLIQKLADSIKYCRI